MGGESPVRRARVTIGALRTAPECRALVSQPQCLVEAAAPGSTGRGCGTPAWPLLLVRPPDIERSLVQSFASQGSASWASVVAASPSRLWTPFHRPLGPGCARYRASHLADTILFEGGGVVELLSRACGCGNRRTLLARACDVASSVTARL